MSLDDNQWCSSVHHPPPVQESYCFTAVEPPLVRGQIACSRPCSRDIAVTMALVWLGSGLDSTSCRTAGILIFAFQPNSNRVKKKTTAYLVTVQQYTADTSSLNFDKRVDYIRLALSVFCRSGLRKRDMHGQPIHICYVSA